MSIEGIEGFRCGIISCEIARRGVQRGAAEASGSGGVQRVWPSIEGSFFLFAECSQPIFTKLP